MRDLFYRNLLDITSTSVNFWRPFSPLLTVRLFTLSCLIGCLTCVSTLQAQFLDDCPSLNANGVYDKETDMVVTTWHSHIARGNRVAIVWGEDMSSDATDANFLTRVHPDSGYLYTGYPIMFAISGKNDAQAFLLTSTGLWAWGPNTEVVGGTIVPTSTFTSMTMPPGVLPGDVLDIKASTNIFFLVTNSGNVWVAGSNSLWVDGNASAANNTWHQVETSIGIPLTGVVEITGNREVVYVRRSDGSLYAWGRGVALAGGAASQDLTYATQMDLTALPGGVTLSHLGTYEAEFANSSGLLALGSDGKVYGVGYEGPGQVISTTTGFINDWTTLKNSSAADITNIVFLATSETTDRYGSAAIIVDAGATNDLYTWGAIDESNIGHPGTGLVEYPTMPAGYTSGVDNAQYVSLGGHASSFYNSANGGSVCFVGHISDGSGGGLLTVPTDYACFNRSDVAWPTDVFICGMAPEAHADTLTAVEDVFTPLDVLANDSDMDALDTASISILTTAVNGTAVADPATGLINYTSDLNYHGLDSLEYRICDFDGYCDSAWVSLTVTPVNDLPLAADDAVSTSEDTPVTFSILSNDTDPSDVLGGIDSATVTVITGPADGAHTIDPSSGAISYTPDLNFSGNDTIVYRVCDSGYPVTAGSCDTAMFVITVSAVNDAPIAVNDSLWINEDDPLTSIDVINNDSDIDGTLDTAGLNIVTAPLNGVAVANTATGEIDYTADAGFNGEDQIQYEICDDGGLCDSAWLIVTVGSVADAPVAIDDVLYTYEDVSASINPLSNDFDVDGDLDSSSVILLSGPFNGTGIIDPVTGDFTFTPNPDFNGLDSLIYRVCDFTPGTPLCAQAKLNINVVPVNDGPYAEDDVVVVDEDFTVNIEMLSNDGDADGILDPLSVTILAFPVNGSVVVNADGTIDYTPAADFFGADIFRYRVCDDEGACVSAYVNITINSVNDGPFAAADFAVTVEGIGIEVDLIGNDTDIDGIIDPLTVTILFGPSNGTGIIDPLTGDLFYTPDPGFSGTDQLTYTACDDGAPVLCDNAVFEVIVNPLGGIAPTAVDDAISIAEDGSITMNPLANDIAGDSPIDPTSVTILSGPSNGTGIIDPLTGELFFSADPDYFGTDAIIYRVCDMDGDCAFANIDITVTAVADAPVAVDDAVTTDEDTPVNITVVSNDTDADGDIDPLTITFNSTPASGAGVIDPLTGDINYTPAANFNGTDIFSYIVCDVSGLCDTALTIITVNAVNDAPVAEDDAATTPINTAILVDVISNDTDVDGIIDPASVTILFGPSNGTGIIDPVTGDINYTPDPGFSGTDMITYSVCDDGSPVACDDAVLVINVGSSVPPVAVNDTITTAEETMVTIVVSSNDISGTNPINPNSVSILSPPVYGTGIIDPLTGDINYTPYPDFSGTDNFRYSICDDFGYCDFADVIVFVSPVDDPPIAVDDYAVTSEDINVSLNVVSNDVDPDGDIDPFSFNVLSGPFNGSVIYDASTGQLTYTPDVNWYGIDSLTYEICDGQPLCDNARVSITINPINDPVVAVLDDITTLEDIDSIIDVMVNDFDPESDGGLDSTSVTIATAPANGSVVVDPITGLITYSPDLNYNGPDFFEYTICDIGYPLPRTCSTATVNIDVIPVDDSPVINTIPSDTLNYCFGDLVVDPSITVAEVDGDSLLAVVWISDGFESGEDLLNSVSFLSSDFNPSTGVLSFTAGTVFEVQSALRTVAYNNLLAPGGELGDVRELSFRLFDWGGSLSSNVESRSVASKSGDPSICDADIDGLADAGECIGGPPCDADGDGTENYLDPDSDDDGIPDSYECADGTACSDTDGDLIPDYLDVDSDNDGISDWFEAGNAMPLGIDSDGDGIDNAFDTDSGGAGLNDTPRDTDADGDADFRDTDSDEDGIPDFTEADNAEPLNIDADGDGIDDAFDTDAGGAGLNDNPTDTDSDSVPDFIDPDSDNDGIADETEAGSDPADPVDSDGDAVPDYRDTDSDGDLIPDNVEADQPFASGDDDDGDGVDNSFDEDSGAGGLVYNPVDTDNDGIADFLDSDTDDDGLEDVVEAGSDPNNPADSDGDGTGDWRDLDSDNDGINDGLLEGEEGLGDCNGNGLVDFIDPQPCSIQIVELFTPNGDGINDEFFIWGIEAYPNAQLLVYNRWENIVYEKTGYDNSWRGEYQESGGNLPDGTYYYLLKLNADDPETETYVGPVTIQR